MRFTIAIFCSRKVLFGMQRCAAIIRNVYFTVRRKLDFGWNALRLVDVTHVDVAEACDDLLGVWCSESLFGCVVTRTL